jgi:ABC-type sugar transport system, permease component
MGKKRIRRRTSDRVIDAAIYGSITFLCLAILYPFYYLLINSFNAKMLVRPVFLYPDVITIENYKKIFQNTTILSAFSISILRTVIGVSVTVIVCSMCAFALRKRQLIFRNFYLAFFTIPMFFHGGLIPTYLNYKMLGFLDHFTVYIIRFAVAFFYIIIFMSSFNNIPSSLEESANIDGAGDFKIYRSIFMPVSLPVIATISLFVGVTHWNSWYDTVYFTQSPWLMTIAGFLLKTIKQAGVAGYMEGATGVVKSTSPEGIKFAIMLVSIVPIAMVYPFVQKFFVKGVMLGAVKG